MKDLKKMRAQLAALKAQGKAKTDEFNALSAKIATLEGAAKEEAETKLTALDGELDALAGDVEKLAGEIDAEEKRARRMGAFASSTSHTSPARATFSSEPNPETTGGFRSIAEFAHSVRNAAVNYTVDERLSAAAPANVHQNGGSSGEGFLVPPEFRDTIWELVHAPGDLLSLVDGEPTGSNAVQFVKDETTPWGSAGVQAGWRAEGTKMDASKQATKGATLQLHELYAFVAATDELLEDAPRLNARLTTKAGEAIRWKASDAIMWGDGVGKPLGFMKSKALISVAKEGGQGAKTIVAENVAKMFSRLLPQNLAGALWLANSDTLPQLMAMKIGDTPIWTPPNAGFQNAPGGFLLGRPIMFTEHADTLGELGDLSLIDPMGFYAPQKSSGITFASSIHLYFDLGLQAFRWTFRMGGQPYPSAPVASARGDNTKSHFVALAQRA